jgi:hypothetical protein
MDCNPPPHFGSQGRIQHMVLFRDGVAMADYSNGERLSLTPCGEFFVATRGEDVFRQRVCFVTSVHRPEVAK